MAAFFKYRLPQPERGGNRKPVAWIIVRGPRRFLRARAVLDTGADITMLPGWMATAIGLSLDQEPSTTVEGIGRHEVKVTVLPVELELWQRRGMGHSWQAGVAFTHDEVDESVLGHHGFLKYFDATFYGAKETVKLVWNDSYRAIPPPSA